MALSGTKSGLKVSLINVARTKTTLNKRSVTQTVSNGVERIVPTSYLSLETEN